MDKDKLIAKLKELNVKQNRFVEYLHTAVEFGEDADWEEVFDHKLTKIKRLESEIASLESELAKEEPERVTAGLRMESNNWPDEVRLKMIEKSEFYPTHESFYQFGFYDGYQYASSKQIDLRKDDNNIHPSNEYDISRDLGRKSHGHDSNEH